MGAQPLKLGAILIYRLNNYDTIRKSSPWRLGGTALEGGAIGLFTSALPAGNRGGLGSGPRFGAYCGVRRAAASGDATIPRRCTLGRDYCTPEERGGVYSACKAHRWALGMVLGQPQTQQPGNYSDGLGNQPRLRSPRRCSAAVPAGTNRPVGRVPLERRPEIALDPG